VDEAELKIYGCDETGNLLHENGISLTELNESWFRLLDRDDRDYLSNLFNNKTN
jgi:hypothetical protein